MAARDFIDPDTLRNWCEIADQRGLTLDQVADQVQPESRLLADALREIAAEQAPAEPPKRERAVKRAAEKRG